jgi:hypothetical protein
MPQDVDETALKLFCLRYPKASVHENIIDIETVVYYTY